MKRRIFYSFHFDNDCWRTQQLRNMGVFDGSQPCSKNDWEKIRGKGPAEIRRWIDSQLNNRTCTVVLIGSETASRPYVLYEIERSFEKGLGVVGVHIHNLKGSDEKQSSKGLDPILGRTVSGRSITPYTKTHNPPFLASENVYNHIANNLSNWIEEAITLRSRF